MKMNTRNKLVLAPALAGMTLALGLVSGCVVRPYGGVAVEAPSPVTVEAGVVPDDYVWDGYEYVGVVGSGYYYLGPNHVWLVAGSDRIARFHGWVRYHPDWHAHAIVNVRYRTDVHGHYQPRRAAPQRKNDRDHKDDYGH